MASKRDTSKQKRARENRAQREALKARTTAASTPTEQRQKARAATPERSAPAKQEKRGFFSPDPNRPPRPGDVPVDLATLQGNWISKRMQVPGGRQVLTAWLLSFVVSASVLIGKVPAACPSDVKGKACVEYGKKHMIPFVDRYHAAAIVLLLVPIVLTGIAAVTTLHPNHRKIWRAMVFLMAVWVAATIGASGIVYLFPTGFLFYGMQRATRIEGPLPSRRQRAAAAASDGEGDGEAVGPAGDEARDAT